MTLMPTTRRVLAEYLGTMILVAAVVGSGIMATTLTDDVGVQLVMNRLATVPVLGLLIWTVGPISGVTPEPLDLPGPVHERHRQASDSVGGCHLAWAVGCRLHPAVDPGREVGQGALEGGRGADRDRVGDRPMGVPDLDLAIG